MTDTTAEHPDHVAEAHQTLVRTAWSAVGGTEGLLELVTVHGQRPGLLSSRLPAQSAMTAAVAASTLAASVLDAARGGRPPAPVSIDAAHVALAARSERHARADDEAPADMFAALSRFWRTSDGWLRLHANYAWHRQRALDVLGLPGGTERPEAVADAVAGWRGEELEDALAAVGGVGYAVRTARQWEQHEQSRAMASAPVVSLVPGRGPGRRLGTGRAAAGARVLDLTRVIAGPVATKTLAAWGADVLRLDSPQLPEIPSQALDTLPGKRSAELDLARPGGRRRLEELLGVADVVVQGYRPGALARYGLDAGDLAQRHPHLSVVSLSAWGATGPWSQRRGFDSMVQCPTGIADLEGDGERPGALPAQVLDHATGYLAAASALLCMAQVETGGPPRTSRLSLQQTAAWLTGSGCDTPEEVEVPVDPEPHLVTLLGGATAVRLIGPPGQAGDLLPSWATTTSIGRDQAAFSTG